MPTVQSLSPTDASQSPRRSFTPGVLAALGVRRIVVAAVAVGPALFLLSTLALVLGLWRGINVGPIVYAATVLLAAGGVIAGLALQRRIKEISAALERSQRTATVGLLTAGFAHEMKNALTVVLGFAELSRTAAEKGGANGPTDPRVVRHLHELESEARRSVKSLQTFLSYAGGEKVEPLARDLDELSREALTMIRPMARMKELYVEETLGTPPKAVCDPYAVRQVLLNLLLNALDFARERVWLETKAGADGFAELRVRDDGPGVPAQDRERIFGRYVTTRPGGNGLGLSTSRQIAEAHGGTLTLEGETGSTFVLRLPPA
ncbi:MAG: HAMP domain-containing histidine kinase [Deltaproteobacteria bacterium]|nr:HAMP domain-containing histidine kinase [Deltaproteobacteria bacterium]